MIHRVVHSDEQRLVIALQGHLRVAEATAFNEVLRIASEHTGSEVVLDLSGVQYMDSTGLSVLARLRSHLEKREAKVRLMEPQEPILSVLRMAGLDRLFDIVQGAAADAIRQDCSA